MVDKVLAYITRPGPDGLQVLVFEHRDFPESGTQVPAGTVEPGEGIEPALWREVEEETGLHAGQLRLEAKLAEFESQDWGTRRHVFHLIAVEALPDAWLHSVGGKGEDRGLAFSYCWAAVQPSPALAGDQGRWLPLLA